MVTQFPIKSTTLMGQTVSQADERLKGVMLKVKAMTCPYILVECTTITGGYKDVYDMIINYNDYKFTKVDDKFLQHINSIPDLPAGTIDDILGKVKI